MPAPNLYGENGPRQGPGAGRLRSTLTNMASKQAIRAFPAVLVQRGGMPGVASPVPPPAGPGSSRPPTSPVPGSSGLFDTQGQSGLGSFAGLLQKNQDSIQQLLQQLQNQPVAPPTPPPGGDQKAPPPDGKYGIDSFLDVIKHFESGNDYTRKAYCWPRCTASGAYQATRETWNWFGGYSDAYKAPKAVQDAWARQHIAAIQKVYGNDPKWIPAAWFAGIYGAGHEDWNQIPGNGDNNLTIQQYVTRWLNYLYGLAPPPGRQ